MLYLLQHFHLLVHVFNILWQLLSCYGKRMVAKGEGRHFVLLTQMLGTVEEATIHLRCSIRH
jgi:hypothetical protein